VTGPLGGAALGRHLRFRPELEEGAWLAAQPAVSACMDVSDGLLIDLAALLRASSRRGRPLGARLEADAIPVSAAARKHARGSAARSLMSALRDGEDYRLLFTVDPRWRELARGGPLRAAARAPIGVVQAAPGLRLAHPSGRVQRFPPLGYEHRFGTSATAGGGHS
jgi:thiamine monophosphate kinase